MITIEEIPVERIDEFWKIHYEYLIRDEIISDDEDKEYFQSEEYRGIIKSYIEDSGFYFTYIYRYRKSYT